MLDGDASGSIEYSELKHKLDSFNMDRIANIKAHRAQKLAEVRVRFRFRFRFMFRVRVRVKFRVRQYPARRGAHNRDLTPTPSFASEVKAKRNQGKAYMVTSQRASTQWLRDAMAVQRTPVEASKPKHAFVQGMTRRQSKGGAH